MNSHTRRGGLVNKNFRCVAAVVGLFLTVALPVSAQQVSVSMNDGRVTLVADNAPLWMVLSEWARVGKTNIVNAEKLTGPPVTLQLVDVPEAEALETVLRSAPGYVVAPRAANIPGASRYDRVLIMPATASSPAAGGGRNLVGLAGASGGQQPRPTGADPNSDEDMPPDVRGRLGPGGMMMRPGQAPGATFDYANPAQLRQFQEQSGTANPYGVPQNPYQSPAVGGVAGSGPTGGAATSGSQAAPRPGVSVPSPQGGTGSSVGPYGMPANTKPGSVIPPPQEPDRSKYISPPKPPGGPGGSGL
jgi:hypothetical protein